MAKYLLEAPDDEMQAGKDAARVAGVPFAEWLRVLMRDAVRGDVPQPPIEKRGGHQPKAEGPAPTKPPPQRSDSAEAAPWKRSYAPDPKPVKGRKK